MTGPELKAALRHLSPAMAPFGLREILRAVAGVMISLSLVEQLLAPVSPQTAPGLFMIASLGASATMMIVLPNSPLAQPWSVLVGNSVAAAMAVTVVLWVDAPALRVVLSAGLAVTAMLTLRALHPPGAAIAVLAALTPEMVHRLGYLFVIQPVLIGSAILMAVAVVWARLTGRRYPFRQPAAEAPATSAGASPAPGIAPGIAPGPTREELAHLLVAYRQSANIGVEDLARLIAAAEELAAADATPCKAADAPP